MHILKKATHTRANAQHNRPRCIQYVASLLIVFGVALVAMESIEVVYACSLSSHCYAQWYAQWHVWPGITGDREEYGAKSVMNTIRMSDNDGTNNFVAQAQWIVHKSGKWVEIGVIQGDFPGCPTLAENAKKYYWISWNGSTYSNGKLMIEGECVSIPSVNKAPVEVSDTNKDGVWGLQGRFNHNKHSSK